MFAIALCVVSRASVHGCMAHPGVRHALACFESRVLKQLVTDITMVDGRCSPVAVPVEDKQTRVGSSVCGSNAAFALPIGALTLRYSAWQREPSDVSSRRERARSTAALPYDRNGQLAQRCAPGRPGTA